MRILTLVVSTLLVLPLPLVAQAHAGREHAEHHDDSAFRAMQARGRDVMGVDQYTSAHRFDPTPDGGRIQLERDRDDSAGTAAIRSHFHTIARSFSAGDFTAPFLVHAEAVPGVPIMRAHRSAIRYEVEDLPRGAALLIRSPDTAAVAAIHRFLAYQRQAHRTGASAHGH